MLTSAVRWIGRFAVRIVIYPFLLSGFLYKTANAAISERGKGYGLFLHFMTLQVYFTGFHALPVATMSAVALGSVVFGNAILVLDQVGQIGLVAKIVPGIIIREVGPILVTLIIIGRSGTAVTTELGNMMVNREISTLSLLGIDVNYLIVVPRVVGITIGVVALAIYFYGAAIIGGFFVVKMLNIAPMNFTFALIYDNIGIGDIVISVIKCMFIGLCVSIIHCYHGLAVKLSPTEVPQQTTKAVVNSITYSVFINGIIFALTYLA